jgi:hypothetical protein
MHFFVFYSAPRHLVLTRRAFSRFVAFCKPLGSRFMHDRGCELLRNPFYALG